MGDEPDDYTFEIETHYTYFDEVEGIDVLVYRIQGGARLRDIILPESPSWFGGRGYFTNRLPYGVAHDNNFRGLGYRIGDTYSTEEGFYDTLQGVLCVIE